MPSGRAGKGWDRDRTAAISSPEENRKKTNPTPTPPNFSGSCNKAAGRTARRGCRCGRSLLGRFQGQRSGRQRRAGPLQPHRPHRPLPGPAPRPRPRPRGDERSRAGGVRPGRRVQPEPSRALPAPGAAPRPALTLRHPAQPQDVLGPDGLQRQQVGLCPRRPRRRIGRSAPPPQAAERSPAPRRRLLLRPRRCRRPRLRAAHRPAAAKMAAAARRSYGSAGRGRGGSGAAGAAWQRGRLPEPGGARGGTGAASHPPLAEPRARHPAPSTHLRGVLGRRRQRLLAAERADSSGGRAENYLRKETKKGNKTTPAPAAPLLLHPRGAPSLPRGHLGLRLIKSRPESRSAAGNYRAGVPRRARVFPRNGGKSCSGSAVSTGMTWSAHPTAAPAWGHASPRGAGQDGAPRGLSPGQQPGHCHPLPTKGQWQMSDQCPEPGGRIRDVPPGVTHRSITQRKRCISSPKWGSLK